MEKKGKYKIILSVMLLLGVVFILIFSNSRFCYVPVKQQYVKFSSCDTVVIDGKIMFPTGCVSDKLVIYVTPCLVTTFKPESDIKELRFDLMLRDKLLNKGIAYFEFVGRKDSILKYDRRYPLSTMFTKVQDLEEAIKYIRSRADLKNKKIVLIGQSEGGATSAVVASKNSSIFAVVLLSAAGVSGSKFMSYQAACKDTLFMGTFGLHPEVFDVLNSMSSIKKKRYEQNIEGFKKFENETYGPLKDIVDKYDDYDTIASHVISYLENKWNMEDEKTKSIHKNFSEYCVAHHHFAYIQPEQIGLLKWKPELYFPKITCPVAVVYGTRDQSVEYSTSITNIRELLVRGGNNKFISFVLKDHNHFLENKRNKPSIQDSSVDQVVDWIVRQ